MPAASSRSIQAPDSRVSWRARNRTWSDPRAVKARAAVPGRNARASAAPSRRIVGMSRGYWPALPRTPSVPNSRPMALLLDTDPHVRRLDLDDADARRRDDTDG